MTELDPSDLEFLTAHGDAGQVLNLPRLIHLDQRIGVRNGVRIADGIKVDHPRGQS